MCSCAGGPISCRSLQGCRYETDGDPTPGGARTPDHHHRRNAVLETGRVKDAGAAAQGLSYCAPRERVDIQISVPPKPPARLDAKSSIRPPPERLGCCSAAVEFSGAPTFTGGVQGSWTLRRVDVQIGRAHV